MQDTEKNTYSAIPQAMARIVKGFAVSAEPSSPDQPLLTHPATTAALRT
jgi:hypothetical protein